jgi:hypothetical protein
MNESMIERQDKVNIKISVVAKTRLGPSLGPAQLFLAKKKTASTAILTGPGPAEWLKPGPI